MRMGYPPFTYMGDNWNVAGVNTDVLQAGFNIEGKIVGAGGNFLVDSEAVKFSGMSYGRAHTATYAGETRTVFEGMRPNHADTAPAYYTQFIKEGSTELLTNGGFEIGNLSGWTEDGGTTYYTITTTPTHTDTYALKFAGGVGDVKAIESDKIAIAAGSNYLLNFYIKNEGAIASAASVYIRWYADSGDTVPISASNTPVISSNTEWLYKYVTSVAPATANYATVRINAINTAGIFYLDDISVTLSSFDQTISFEPEMEIDDGLISRTILPLPAVIVCTSGGFAVPDTSETTISFDYGLLDYHDMWQGGYPSRVYAVYSGYQIIAGNVVWDANTTGDRVIKIKNSSTGDVGMWVMHADDLAYGLLQSFSIVTYAVAGTYYYLTAYQTSGGERSPDAYLRLINLVNYRSA